MYHDCIYVYGNLVALKLTFWMTVTDGKTYILALIAHELLWMLMGKHFEITTNDIQFTFSHGIFSFMFRKGFL